jgi:hypothetical protein
MTTGEAVLYGDLVKFVRDLAAEELAQLRETMVDAERELLDQAISDWFFTPQPAELLGLSPRDYIRCEQRGECPLVPREHLRDAVGSAVRASIHQHARVLSLGFDDDCAWEFELAPEWTLIDEYDPDFDINEYGQVVG